MEQKTVLIKKKRCRALVAFGDTAGFNAYSDRFNTSDKNFADYCVSLTRIFVNFKNKTGYFVKPMGDGCMVVDELDLNANGLATAKFLKNLDQLQKAVKTFIDGMEESAPDDFLVRGAGGPCLRLSWGSDLDYFGRAINKAERLKGIYRNIPFVCHTSAKKLLTEKRATAEGIRLESLSVPEIIPFGLNQSDVIDLSAYTFS